MTLEPVMARVRHELAQSDGPLDVKRFLATFYPHGIEAGQQFARAFHRGLLRSRLATNLVGFNGQISAIVDDTRPVWH